MADVRDDGLAPDPFAWHPTYAGRSVAEVLAEIRADLASDQRQYALALEGAEQHENSVLRSIVALERKWGPFDMNWAEADVDTLAVRVLAFEQERERRRALIPYAAYRAEQQPVGAVQVTTGETLLDRLVGVFRGRKG